MFSVLLVMLASQPVLTAAEFAELLDIDRDGIICPMEAADAIHMIVSESDQQGLFVDNIEQQIKSHRRYLEEDAEELISDFDVNGDNKLQMGELPDELASLARYSDANGDGSLTVDEIIQLHPDSDEAFAKLEVEEIFSDLDDDGDGLIAVEELVDDDEEFGELVKPFDVNADGQMSRSELIDAFAILDSPVRFDIEGSNALMNGTIGASTPFRVMELVFYHHEVDTIVMVNVPGSIDDDSCLRASQMVRAHRLNTHVRSDGEVASGGTDFFQAGVKRTCERGAKFGIHSWSEFGAEGSDYPRDSEEHKMYLDYYDEMGIPQSFYWYTLEVATANDIYWMTEEELGKYNMVTSPIIK